MLKRQNIKEGMKQSEAGRKIAEARTGKKFTRKSEEQAKRLMVQHCKCFGGSLTDAQAMELVHISRPTFYKYKREIIEASQEQGKLTVK